jgi:diguanylate cyclase
MMQVRGNWKTHLSFGVLLALGLPLADRFGLRDPWYFMIVFYSLFGICYGVKLNKPAILSPWVYFFLALTFQFIGALIQSNTDASGLFGAVLSPADCFLLFGHLFMAVALWQFASKLHQKFPKYGFFQGWILATSLILIGWQFLFLPTIFQYGFSLHRPQTFRMIYPTMSYVEMGMLLWIWVSSEASQSKAFILLVMATVFFAAGEAMFHGTSYSLGVPQNFNLILWLLGYIAFGSVALHPEMNKLGIPKRIEESSHVNNVLTLLLPLVLLLPITLLIIYFKALHPAAIGILFGFFLVIVLGWYQLRASMQNIVNMNQLLERQNRTDYLTGIPNRNGIEHVVSTSTDKLSKIVNPGYNGLLLIDIDGFKAINNTFGFSVGDSILKSIAVTLHAESFKNGHNFARVDGDEFTLLMNNIENSQHIKAQAWQIHQLLDTPIKINGAMLKVSCSIGISINPAAEKVSFDTMLKESERSLVWAKENQSQVEVYDKNKDIEESRGWVLADFRGAIAAHQLVVYYQPKVNISSKKVLGVEALVRWHHPERGLVMPDRFLHHIESTDLIHSLFVLVLNDATKQWRLWYEQGLIIGMALNVTARDLIHFDLVNEIRGALVKNNMLAKYLEIEITESSALSDPARVKKVLSGLMDLGVKTSIDDYGTGYSSLLYLQQLPLNYLKIDQQFIREMRTDKSSEAIVRSTMKLAKNLNIEVIAEGVDDVRVYKQLKRLGCYGVQGFLFSKAVEAESIYDAVKTIESANFL